MRALLHQMLSTAGCAAFAVAMGCALLGLLGLAGAVSPEADAINQLLPIWAIGGTLCALFAIATRPRHRLAPLGALAVLLILGGPALLRESRATPSPESAPVVRWRMIQFNLAKDNVDPERTAAWILAQNADVLVLEEGLAKGGKVVSRLKEHYPWHVSCHGQGRCSTMILTRTPMIESAGLAKGDAENRRALSAAGAAIEIDGHRANIAAVHLVRPWPFDDQRVSVDKLGRLIRLRPTQSLILSGDFNMTPWTYAARRNDRTFGLDRVTHGVATWPARIPGGGALPVPVLGLDQVYTGGCWQALGVTRGPRLGSDHYPLIVDWGLAATKGC